MKADSKIEMAAPKGCSDEKTGEAEFRRPKSAFRLFFDDKRRGFPGANVQEIVQPINEMWDNATLDEKRVYEDLAKASSDEFWKSVNDFRENEAPRKRR